jgi:hypothetical protein
MSKKIMSMLLTSLFICLAFSGSLCLDVRRTAHAFFPKRLSNHCQGFQPTFSEICTKFDAVPSQNHIRPDKGT